MIDVIELKNSYWDRWNEVKDKRREDQTSWQLLDTIAESTDTFIRDLFDKFDKISKGITLVAFGGYARRQMAPHSDIDLLILHKGRINRKQKEFLNEFTAALWDVGVNPGIQIKELGEVAKAAFEDEVVRTSFIDHRYLCGNEKIYASFEKIVRDKIIEKGKTDFVMMKIDSARNRAKKFRDSIYRLEPNIKEGSGGIRDINTIYWVCKILFKTDNLQDLIRTSILTVEEFEQLNKCAEFLFKIRCELHYYHNRKYDVLNMDAQAEVAEQMGYVTTSSIHRAELFMRDYYKTAKLIAAIADKVINRTLTEFIQKKLNRKVYINDISRGFLQYGNLLTLKSKDLFLEKPERMLQAFSTAADRGLKISDSTYDTIRKNLYMVDGAYLKKHGELFVRIISKFPNSGKIMERMAKSGLLQAMIPEFDQLDCMPQFDYYHHYTVDEHTFLALKYIDGLSSVQPPSTEAYAQAYRSLKRKDLLAMSILLHDIGKGQGKNHSIVGAHMSRIICKRLGMTKDDIDIVASMVEYHLLMSHVSQRRDISSMEEINHFIGFLNSKEELTILFLLTYADVNAVGGDIFNEWRNNLLKQLYESSLMAFDHEDTEVSFNKIVQRKSEKLSERIGKDEEKQKIIAGLDEEYIYSNDVKHMMRDIELALKAASLDTILVEVEEDFNLKAIEITVCAHDYVGLLRRVAGALASLGYNILLAKINTLGGNVAIDTLIVNNPFNSKEIPEEKRAKIVSRIKDAVTGGFDIAEGLERSSSEFNAPKDLGKKKTKIVFDNDVSSRYTVVDIYTKDKLGLLYGILGVFIRLGLSVAKAKISTDVDRVVDSFYVSDGAGLKIDDESRLELIREELLNELRD